MKLSAHEEYGLRCLLQIGCQRDGRSMTIPQISRLEGISIHYTGKILQTLREAGFLKAARGQAGGYTLARPPEQIIVGDALAALGGRLYREGFCTSHTGHARLCTHNVDCSVRSLWRTVQKAVDEVLNRTTLRDLIRTEDDMRVWLTELPTAPAPGLIQPLMETKSADHQDRNPKDQ
ncbi:MAG: Rrf2 family transcriptional regulator [Bryobacteraceae bacterium]